MMMLRITAIFLCTGLITIQAAGPENRMIIGMDPALSAGSDALRSGDYQEGLDLTLDGLNSTLTLRDRASALSNLCAGYLGMGDNANALEACDKALEFNARNWRIYNNRALALLGVGRIAAALGEVEKGLALNPDSQTLAKVARLIDVQASHRLVHTGPEMDRH